eukprot:Plantae.Rhodophyta-Hildenbrandia_rubra.ctg6639.p1 GENE.Plantae.Rhodophyta-Hildenbrandia_rubra.ctg6639~~Plantae.Rhodophyta-Hildenbrandia_rubra.ctg6639.p1  ORF type:complete len:519 (+),score=74.13 Plantae.Rhodophyta-Hildenbrandia_rubra.ctg6639:262-1818(+)
MTRRARTPSSSAEPSTARRSERLRRRRAMQQQENPGVETPGNYSLYKNAFVVASESTLHPSTKHATPSSPAITEDNSRRARYRKSSLGLSGIAEEAPPASEGHTVGSARRERRGFASGSFGESGQTFGTWASGGLRSVRKAALRISNLFSPPSPASDRSEVEEMEIMVDGDDEIAVDTARTNDITPTQLFAERSSYKLRKALSLLGLTVCALAFYSLFLPAVHDEATLSARTSPFTRGDTLGMRRRILQTIGGARLPRPSAYYTRLLNSIRSNGGQSPGITMEQLEIFERRVLEEAKQAAADEAASVSKNFVLSGSSTKMGSADIEAASRRVIEMYEADKGAEPDYALLSAGARVLDSEPSHTKQYARFLATYATNLLRRTMFAPTAPKPPSVAFTPGTTPGKCWAFSESTGSVTVRLARPIVPTGFTMEHTPASSAFSVDSAPRIFRVLGLGLTSREGMIIGQWEYKKGEGYGHMQSWAVKHWEVPIRAVRLEILSNQGADFTCLYRFRVHGKQVSL